MATVTPSTTDRLSGSVAVDTTDRTSGSPSRSIRFRVPVYLLLSGDQQSGGDRLKLSGDMVTDTGDLLLLNAPPGTTASTTDRVV